MSTHRNHVGDSSLKYTIIFLLITAVILVIGLTVSIALLFTLGVKAIRNQNTDNSFISPLGQPCSCGCSTIKTNFQNQSVQLNSRIINGETAAAHSWPWQVLVLIVNRNKEPISFCGATLITDRHILTAAHCVHQTFPPYIYIFTGKHALNFSVSLTTGHLVNKVFVHEEYNTFAYNDIAILTIENPIRLDDQVKPICLASPTSSALREKEDLVTIGWGRISSAPDTNIYPEYLQQVELFYIPNYHPNCSEIERPMVPVHAGEMCAGKPGHNACMGDSGGPLMRRVQLSQSNDYYWEQVGIVSKTVDCGWNSTWPDVYANVAYYHDWILSILERAN